jgi:predicted Zn-dependent protease
MAGFLEAWRNWRDRRQTLRHLSRLQADQNELDRFKVRDLLEEALAAINLNDRYKGAAIWAEACERFPTIARSSPLVLDLLLKLNRYDEAEALMLDGRKKHPGDVFYAKGLAKVAFERGDYEGAIERSAKMQKRFPGTWQGYVLGAQALASAGRLDEADAVAKTTMKRFPEEICGFLEYCRVAVRRQDWEESYRRWKLLQDSFPGWVFGPIGRAEALIGLRRYDEADEILTEARIRFPTESGLLACLARCACARGNVDEAIVRWRRAISLSPMEIHVYRSAAIALEEIREYGEAEAILLSAIERFPLEENLGRVLADLKLRRKVVSEPSAKSISLHALRRSRC